MSRKRRLFPLLIAISLAVALVSLNWESAMAQAEPTGLKDVKVWIYPEYDDPRLLVMFEGQVEGVEIPATIRFLVPNTAEMYSAGSKDALGQYTGGPPDRQPSSQEGWDEISYVLSSTTFRMEYYAPLIKGHPDKSIDFEYRFLYPVSGLRVTVQEPYSSSNFSVIPSADSTFQEIDFNNHLYNYSNLAVEEPLNIDIAYTKSEQKPSLTLLEGGSSGTPVMAGIVIGLVALVVIGLLWAFRPGAGSGHRTTRKKARVRSSAAKKKPLPDQYCIGCGNRRESPHQFCPHCGTRYQ